MSFFFCSHSVSTGANGARRSNSKLPLRIAAPLQLPVNGYAAAPTADDKDPRRALCRFQLHTAEIRVVTAATDPHRAFQYSRQRKSLPACRSAQCSDCGRRPHNQTPSAPNPARAARAARPVTAGGPSLLGHHRTIRQENSARCFGTGQRLKNAAILDVFQVFQTAILGQKIRRRPQTQLRGVALEYPAAPAHPQCA